MRMLFFLLMTLLGLGVGVGIFLLVAWQVHWGDYGPSSGGLVALGLSALTVPLGGVAGAVFGLRRMRNAG